jgi:hypothetical protein
LGCARASFAAICGLTLLKCSLLVDTGDLAGGGGAEETSTDAAVPEAAVAVETSVDARTDDGAPDASRADADRGDAAVFSGNGHAYLAVATGGPVTWSFAKGEAEKRGGHLATLTSPEENQFVYGLVRDRPELFDSKDFGPWIGGVRTVKDAGAANGWSWVTGEPWSYTLWGIGQPDNDLGVEDAVHYYPQGNHTFPVWNDLSPQSTEIKGYVIEFE